MADNTAVKFSGGWAFYQGKVASGATLAVVNAGGSDTDYANIFTDARLTTASANPITADSGGLLPFAYIGTTDYKVILKTSAGVPIKTEDNIPGAISSTISANTAIPVEEVNELTADTTLGTVNIGQTLNCTPSSTFTVTLGSAVTIGDGKGFRIVHSGTANQVKIVTSNGETIVRSNKSITAFALVGFGHSVKLISDGANWLVVSEAHPGPVSGCKVIPVTDRISAAPSSPTPGDFFIVTADFSTYSEGDLLEADGQGGFTIHTPPTDCGWIAYVQDENRNYQFVDSAWVAQPLSTPAMQTTMEAASTAVPVTADVLKFHPAVPKCVASISASGTLLNSFGISSVTLNGTGDYTITSSAPFSSTNAMAAIVSGTSFTVVMVVVISYPSTSTVRVQLFSGSGSDLTSMRFSIAIFGDQ